MKNTFRKPNQHFVPCFYLDFFAYSEGVRKPHLYVYDKKNVKFFSDATKNLGCEDDIYTLPGFEDIYAWDNYYTSIEPGMAALFRETIQSATNMLYIDGNRDIITEEKKQKLSAYIAIQLARGKKYLEFSNFKGDEIEALIKELGIEDLNIDFPQKEDIAEMSTSSRLLSRYMLHLHNRSWIFYYTREESFITSDEPIIMFHVHNDKQGLFSCGISDPNTIVCFPLSPHILLTMYHPFFNSGKANGFDRKRVVLGLNAQQMDFVIKNNKGQLQQCSRFIYGKSEKVLKDTVV